MDQWIPFSLIVQTERKKILECKCTWGKITNQKNKQTNIRTDSKGEYYKNNRKPNQSTLFPKYW